MTMAVKKAAYDRQSSHRVVSVTHQSSISSPTFFSEFSYELRERYGDSVTVDATWMDGHTMQYDTHNAGH